MPTVTAPRSNSSPWPGSRHETRHRWQLDPARDLADVLRCLHRLTDELTAAHDAGWWLLEAMRGGHLLAARASRRQRVNGLPARAAVSPPALVPWRLRLVDEPAVAGQQVLDLEGAHRTPVLAWTDDDLAQTRGPALPDDVLADVRRQVNPDVLGQRPWGLASTPGGPGFDLIADGSALRLHAVEDGALVRTEAALVFQHAADGAATLVQAAAAYERLARQVEAVAATSGRLIGVDDGLLHVAYGQADR